MAADAQAIGARPDPAPHRLADLSVRLTVDERDVGLRARHRT